MRYYHYGADAVEMPLKSNGMAGLTDEDMVSCRDRDLVVEEDTIYEIDRECINCKKGRKETAEHFFAL